MQDQATFSSPIDFIATLLPSGTLEDGKSLYFMDLKMDTKPVKLKPYLLKPYLLEICFAVNIKIWLAPLEQFSVLTVDQLGVLFTLVKRFFRTRHSLFIRITIAENTSHHFAFLSIKPI